MVASFLMPWERLVGEKPCCITGCDHRANGNQGTLAHPDFCSTNNAAAIYDERLMPGPKPDPFVGIACPHCVDEILARDA